MASPGRYRPVDCSEYIHHNTLSVREFTDLSLAPYAAISYIWKSNVPSPEEYEEIARATFTVVGGEDGDPVSTSVLHEACSAALLEGAAWLWLDCLCIMQTNGADKAWQIQHMYDIYRGCQVCIVMPGGLSRLVSIDEETKWITRAWTLQEVVAPPKAVVLLKWQSGSGRWSGWDGGVQGEVTEVSRGASAKLSLHQLLNACHYPQSLTWTPDDGTEPGDISPVVLGDGGASVGALQWAISATDPEERAMALWQSSLLRTSSRPVDMVFSIMGAFGVALDPRLFHVQDRIGATIALAQGILRQGGKPVWLGLSLDIRPSPFLSSFPDFPVTDVSGKIVWSARRGPLEPNVSDAIYESDSMNEEIDDGDESDGEDASLITLPEYWLTDLPSGTMDDQGYLTISAQAVRIVPTGQIFGKRRTHLFQNNSSIDGDTLGADVPRGVLRVVATDGRVWDILHDVEVAHTARYNESSPVAAYIMIIGTSKRFQMDPVYQPDPRHIGGIILPEMSPIRACVVEEHRPGKFHRSSTFLLEVTRFKPFIEKWSMLSVALGGPNVLPPNTRLS